MKLIYGITAALSLLLLIGCCAVVKQKKHWFVLLFSAVLVVNCGYTLLSLSMSLTMALHANRIAYLGSVFLPFSMLMSLLHVTNTPYKKRVPYGLLTVAVVVFFITASQGIFDVYYKAVSFKMINGVGHLVKVYGPLHKLYLLYLLGYFVAMITILIRAYVKKTIDSVSHGVILSIAVFVNIGVWAIEQFANIDFEFLSVSYIISELFLLGVHLVVNENRLLRELVKRAETIQSFSATTIDTTVTPTPTEMVAPEQLELFVGGMKRLTATEKAIFDAYVSRITTKEIMKSLHITENTLKYHNKNLYGKLGVNSRSQLFAIYQQLKSQNI